MFRGANGEETWNEPIEQDAKGNAANRVEDSEGNEDNEDGQWEAEDPVPENYEDDPDQQVEEETLYDSEKPTDTPEPYIVDTGYEAIRERYNLFEYRDFGRGETAEDRLRH